MGVEACSRVALMGETTLGRVQIDPLAQDRFLGLKISPLTRRRLRNFHANRRGYWSFWIFLVLFVVTLVGLAMGPIFFAT